MSRSTADRISGVGSTASGWLFQALERISPDTKDSVARRMARGHVKLCWLTGGRFVGKPGAPSLLLTTTGRRSGQPRTTALFYLADGDRQVLVASYAG